MCEDDSKGGWGIGGGGTLKFGGNGTWGGIADAINADCINAVGLGGSGGFFNRPYVSDGDKLSSEAFALKGITDDCGIKIDNGFDFKNVSVVPVIEEVIVISGFPTFFTDSMKLVEVDGTFEGQSSAGTDKFFAFNLSSSSVNFVERWEGDDFFSKSICEDNLVFWKRNKD